MKVGNPEESSVTRNTGRLIGLAKPTELKDWAYETIKGMILQLEFGAGDQLRVEALSEQMGVSRTPIREALLRLEGEGLVRVAPRVGFFVRGVTKQDLRELFELRELTEGYAAEKAAARLSEADLRLIEALQQDSEQAVAAGNLDRFNEVEIALHSTIIRSSRNRRLLEMIESIKDLTFRERRLALRSPENVRESMEEHRRIVEALCRKDGRMAGQAMRRHIRAVAERLLKFLSLPEQESED